MSNSPKVVFRGNLRYDADLIALFKFMDEWTVKDDKEKPYDKRRYHQGVFAAASKQFSVDVKTIKNRLSLYPNGLNQSSHIKRGESSQIEEAWEKTGCYVAIKAKITKSWDDKTGFFNKKGQKYNTPLKRAWQIFKHKDPLKFGWEDWAIIWGSPAKTPDRCHPEFKDEETRLLRFDFAIAFRFAMRNSVFPDVKDAIVTEDGRFDTNSLKRAKGKHKDEFLHEEQAFALPRYLVEFDTLMLCYSGILFGGRFEALRKANPQSINREAHQVILFESKVQKEAPKPIYEPETSFLYRYVVECGFKRQDRLFPRSMSQYNRELTAAANAMAKEHPDLELLDKDGNHWELTTHRAFKHTCITQMSLHGVRSDTISDYVKTDPNTISEFYRGGSAENIDVEIGGIERKIAKPTWRAFVIELSKRFEARFNELKKSKVMFGKVRGELIPVEMVRA